MAGSNDYVIAGRYSILNDPTTLPTALETKSAFVEVGSLICHVYGEEIFTHVQANVLSYANCKSYVWMAKMT
jgi:hypothetical protein